MAKQEANQREKNVKPIWIPILLSLHIALPIKILGAEMLDIRRAEKISLALTGVPLTPEQRAAVIQGKLNVETLTEELSKGPGFIDRFAEYWTRLLGAQATADIFELKTKTGVPQSLSAQGRYPFVYGVAIDKTYTSDKLQNILKGLKERKGIVALNIKQCPDAPMIIGSTQGPVLSLLQSIVDKKATPTAPILEGTLPDWQNLLAFMKTVQPTCEDTLPRIKPYWDPKEVTIFARYKGVESYRVSTEVLAKCGAALEKCNLTDARAADRYSNFVARDLTMEPGYIISHTVAEDRPWTDVVTTADTIITGTYAEWLTNKGAPLWDNFPGKSYEGAKMAIFTKPDIYDRKHYRVRRNALHSGVLTTPGFQLITNGRRAKANRAFESFLCQKFTVPEGANPDPNDANPDLTKRAYCSFCHKTLEPMAAFWNRWPETGTINYMYSDAANVNDNGSFNGLSGPGAAAFGKTLVSSPAFGECAIKRAFEFVYGRKITSVESDNMMPEWLAQYEAAQQNLRPVIKAMVLSPEFMGGGK
jgi:hypothetical protein